MHSLIIAGVLTGDQNVSNNRGPVRSLLAPNSCSSIIHILRSTLDGENICH